MMPCGASSRFGTDIDALWRRLRSVWRLTGQRSLQYCSICSLFEVVWHRYLCLHFTRIFCAIFTSISQIHRLGRYLYIFCLKVNPLQSEVCLHSAYCAPFGLRSCLRYLFQYETPVALVSFCTVTYLFSLFRNDDICMGSFILSQLRTCSVDMAFSFFFLHLADWNLFSQRSETTVEALVGYQAKRNKNLPPLESVILELRHDAFICGVWQVSVRVRDGLCDIYNDR